MSTSENDYSYYGGNHSHYPFWYYDDMDTYEIETFNHWDDATIKILNKAFLGTSIFIAVVDFLLLLSVFCAQTRKQSASWYLYHLIMVTVLMIALILPRMEEDTNTSFGSCMFLSFAELTLDLVFKVNQILWNIEIITIIAPHRVWSLKKLVRFIISMNTTWISCILFSVLLKFFGHNEEKHIPVCFHENRVALIIENLFRLWFPAFIIIVEVITGTCLFIRTKFNPEIRRELVENPERRATVHEWFTLFIIWNLITIISESIKFTMHELFFEISFVTNVILQILAFMIGISIPICSLVIKDIRDACASKLIAVVVMITRKRRLSTVSDTQVLSMESAE